MLLVIILLAVWVLTCAAAWVLCVAVSRFDERLAVQPHVRADTFRATLG